MVRLGHYRTMEIISAYEVAASCGPTRIRFIVLTYLAHGRERYSDCSFIGLN